ncbi:MAG: hypothetical protein WBC91_21250 [Phototrophicaceae bacterium]
MTSHTHWFDDEKTIIIHEVIGNWRIADVLAEMIDTELALDTKLHQPKYFIIDLQEAIGVPEGILLHRPDYDNIIDEDSLTIVVGAHPIIKTFINAMRLMGLAGTTIVVDTIQEAQYFIQCHKEECK